jgi:hypothetical protein
MGKSSLDSFLVLAPGFTHNKLALSKMLCHTSNTTYFPAESVAMTKSFVRLTGVANVISFLMQYIMATTTYLKTKSCTFIKSLHALAYFAMTVSYIRKLLTTLAPSTIQ